MRGIFFILFLTLIATAEDYLQNADSHPTEVIAKVDADDHDTKKPKVIQIKGKPLKGHTETKKITVVEDDTPETDEKSNLRAFTETKKVGPKITMGDKDKSTKSVVVKKHKHMPVMKKGLSKNMADSEPVVAYVEEKYLTEQSPVNQVALVNQANELKSLQEDAAARALLMSETALANGGQTADENLENQNYLRSVAAHSSGASETEADDLYNASQGDLTQTQFSDAQGGVGELADPLEGNEVASQSTGTDFVGVGGAWQKFKNMLGVKKSSSKSSPSEMKVVETSATTARTTAFKFTAKAIQRNDDDDDIDGAGQFLENDGADDDDDDDGSTVTTTTVTETSPSEDDE